MGVLHTVNSIVSWPMFDSGAVSDSKHEKLLQAAGLPAVLIERNPTLVPLHAGEKWLDLLLRDVGDDTYHFKIISSSEIVRDLYRKELDDFHLRTPVELASRVIEISNMFSSGAKITSKISGEVLTVYRLPGTTPWTNTWPAIQVILGIIYNAVNVAFGDDLQPVGLRVPLQKRPSRIPEMLSGIPVYLGSPGIGLDYSTASLNSLLRACQPPKPKANLDYFPLTNDVSHETVRACLSGYLLSNTTDKLSLRVASAFGLSNRQYRRQLKAMGTTHARLLDEAKLNLSLDLLENTSISISEVSLELGYNHPGDLTRFIRRKTGMCPRELRRALPRHG